MISDIMRCLLLFLPLLTGIVHADECNEVKKEFNQCTRDAHNTYLNAMKKEGDGREHYRARKACHYLTEAIEICGNKLLENDCTTVEQVNAMKDSQVSMALTNLNTSIKDFDSSKCPAVKSSLDRVCAADPECVPDDRDYRDYSGASSVVVSVLLLPLLVVHQL